jgi:predicted RNA binding protein YcfA (HicA-like mRNA interferase family)
MKKEFAVLARIARRAGWTVKQQRGGHVAWRSPSGARVTSSTSPSDRRALYALKRDLRRAGLPL